jgi:hypothetical protein
MGSRRTGAACNRDTGSSRRGRGQSGVSQGRGPHRLLDAGQRVPEALHDRVRAARHALHRLQRPLRAAHGLVCACARARRVSAARPGASAAWWPQAGAARSGCRAPRIPAGSVLKRGPDECGPGSGHSPAPLRPELGPAPIRTTAPARPAGRHARRASSPPQDFRDRQVGTHFADTAVQPQPGRARTGGAAGAPCCASCVCTSASVRSASAFCWSAKPRCACVTSCTNVYSSADSRSARSPPRRLPRRGARRRQRRACTPSAGPDGRPPRPNLRPCSQPCAAGSPASGHARALERDSMAGDPARPVAGRAGCTPARGRTREGHHGFSHRGRVGRGAPPRKCAPQHTLLPCAPPSAGPRGRGRALEEGCQRAECKGGVGRPVPERGLGQRNSVPQRRLGLLAPPCLLLHEQG